MSAVITIQIGPGDRWGKTEKEDALEEAQERAYHEICERGILDIIKNDADEILFELWDGDLSDARKMLKTKLAAHLGQEYTELLGQM